MRHSALVCEIYSPASKHSANEVSLGYLAEHEGAVLVGNDGARHCRIMVVPAGAVPSMEPASNMMMGFFFDWCPNQCIPWILHSLPN